MNQESYNAIDEDSYMPSKIQRPSSPFTEYFHVPLGKLTRLRYRLLQLICLYNAVPIVNSLMKDI